MSESNDHLFRLTVERAGAEYRGIKDGCVFFLDPQSMALLSLYEFACTGDNVRLSLKSARERNRQTSKWQTVNQSERG
jgi:hypothetical protein